MHIGDFLAVGNGYTCDGNRPRMPCMHAGKETRGKPLPWVGVSLSGMA